MPSNRYNEPSASWAVVLLIVASVLLGFIILSMLAFFVRQLYRKRQSAWASVIDPEKSLDARYSQVWPIAASSRPRQPAMSQMKGPGPRTLPPIVTSDVGGLNGPPYSTAEPSPPLSPDVRAWASKYNLSRSSCRVPRSSYYKSPVVNNVDTVHQRPASAAWPDDVEAQSPRSPSCSGEVYGYDKWTPVSPTVQTVISAGPARKLRIKRHIPINTSRVLPASPASVASPAQRLLPSPDRWSLSNPDMEVARLYISRPTSTDQRTVVKVRESTSAV